MTLPPYDQDDLDEFRSMLLKILSIARSPYRFTFGSDFCSFDDRCLVFAIRHGLVRVLHANPEMEQHGMLSVSIAITPKGTGVLEGIERSNR